MAPIGAAQSPRYTSPRVVAKSSIIETRVAEFANSTIRGTDNEPPPADQGGISRAKDVKPSFSLEVPFDKLEAVLQTLARIDSSVDKSGKTFIPGFDQQIAENAQDEGGIDIPAETDTAESGRAGDQDKKQSDEIRMQPEESRVPTCLVYPERCIPEVRYCDFEEFMTFHTEEQGLSAIQVFVRDSEKAVEQQQGEEMEWVLHANGSLNAFAHRQRPDPKINSKHTHMPCGGSGRFWIQEIRIMSRPILETIIEAMPEPDLGEWKHQPTSFVMPFRPLIWTYEKIKKKLEVLEAEAEDRARAEVPPFDPTLAKEPDSGQAALDDLRCYIGFLAEEIMPILDKFKGYHASNTGRIRFDSFHHLFKIGELIHVPATNDAMPGQTLKVDRLDPAKGPGTVQSLWRVYSLHVPSITIHNPSWPPSKYGKSHYQSIMGCYRIDYDGTSYGAITRTIVLEYFEGEQEITDLPFYPIRFLRDHEKFLQKARDEGDLFAQQMKKRFGSYSGWTVLNGPDGERLLGEDGKVITTPDHVESDVLVDFREAFNKCPHWKPEFEYLAPRSALLEYFQSACPILRRTASGTYEKLFYPVVNRDALHREQDKFIQDGKFLTYSGDGSNSDTPPTGDDLCLLPRRMFGYAVLERRFLHLDVRFLRRLSSSDSREVFENLQINETNKKLIISLVHSHFENKRLERNLHDIGSQDLIRGKGKGVVILLHGVPGVGKTATAEAVAQKYGRPLFPITCGDLGITAESVEKSLRDIFRLAQLWDCVLLLDEADVFITQRTKNDLNRNALVSVFLRMLEYYNGILFLTTNRVGVLDEAVKSRVHLNLRYDELSRDQVKKIFKINIDRLRKLEEARSMADPDAPRLFIMEKRILDFAEKHYDKHTSGIGRWNGRQIRNAFLIAASLAHYEGEENEGAQRQLRADHFQDVEATTLLYDKYRASVLQGTDSSMALRREERADDMESSEETWG